MKKIVCMLTLTLTALWVLDAQTITSGTYKSENGLWSVSLTLEESGELTVIAGGKKEKYLRSETRKYCNTEQTRVKFCLDVINERRIYAYPDDGRDGTYYNLAEESSSLTQVDTDCPLAKKYLEKMETDDEGAQVWSYCGYAATLKCTSTQSEMLDELLLGMVENIKLIYKGENCPCSDVIPDNLWNK